MALYAFDGTGNRINENSGDNSNVLKFVQAYLPKGSEDDGYLAGVGTRFRWMGKFFGTMFGMGGRSRVAEQLDRVERKFAEGDRVVDVVGFSRGGALALHFVNKLAKKNIEVRFLGLFDVVPSFGIPINIGPFKFNEINIGWKLTLPPNVKNCFHAMALDERRQSFRVHRVQGAYEVWFRGVHSDIGGGNGNEALSNIALAWMLRKAKAVGVPIDPAAIDRAVATSNPEAAVRPELDPIRNDFRNVIPPAWVHYTLKVRDHEHCRPLPTEYLVETADDEQTRLIIQ